MEQAEMWRTSSFSVGRLSQQLKPLQINKYSWLSQSPGRIVIRGRCCWTVYSILQIDRTWTPDSFDDTLRDPMMIDVWKAVGQWMRQREHHFAHRGLRNGCQKNGRGKGCNLNNHSKDCLGTIGTRMRMWASERNRWRARRPRFGKGPNVVG